MSKYRKAILSGVIGTVVTVIVAIQASLAGGITPHEWLTIATVAIGGLGSAFGVYQIPNEN